jgi:TonB-linked outer membrane protein, SusC/RagA family
LFIVLPKPKSIIMKHLFTLVGSMLITGMLLCSGGTAYAQDLKVTGKVTDASNGSPLIGATVYVKGTTNGTATDLDGMFSLNAPKGSTLVISSVGYTTQEVAITGATVNVLLAVSTQQLQEVVVIGYGTVKKSDATGSVVAVSSDDFNKGAITSPQDLLVGKSAGVVITNAGGAPGSGATIRIRGGSSLNASNDPLIVVDGVPISNNDVSGSSNFLSFINPNDIATFTVLKDASATAIYGSRASNGVILITTKKGKVGSALTIRYDGNTSVSSAIKFIDVYSGDEIRNIAFSHPELYDATSLTKLWNYNTNWQKEIFRTSVSQDHNISVTGAYKSLPYRVSVGYTDQNGILKNTDMSRYTGSIGLDPSFLEGTLKVSVNAKGMLSKNNFGNSDAIGSAINMDPTKPVRDGNVASGGYFQWSNYDANLGTYNPVEQLMDIDNKSTVKRFVGNAQFDYKLPFIEGLHANLNLATDYTTSDGHNNLPITAPIKMSDGFIGKLNNYTGTNYNNLLDFYLNYTKDLSAISSKVDVTGGYSWQHFKRDGNSNTRGIIANSEVPDTTSFTTENYLVSFFGRLNYTFKDRYLFTFTIRDDGSSRFINNKWGLFPAAAFAWKIKDESFLKDVKVISDMKLRLGWGVTGQQDIGSDYPAQALFSLASPGSYYFIDGKYIPTLRPSAYDPNIKWEETTTQNIGLDFGLFSDRITGSVDLYKRTTDNLLNSVPIPTGSNNSNRLLTNVGSLENKGIEVSLNTRPISKKDMSLEVGFNVTYNENKITKLLLSDDPTFIGILEGDAMTGYKQITKVGYAAHSFFLNKQVYDVNGDPIEGLYADLSGQGGSVSQNTADQYIHKNPAPDYLLGFSFRFEYKNFDISGSARASIGNYVYNLVAAGASYDQMSQIGYWKNFTKRLDDTKFVKRQFTSDFFLENASFFKIDNLSAGYNFNKIYGKMNARVSFTVQNVLTVTKYSGLDPEVSGGIDNNFYPRPRVFMLGLSLTF